MRVTAEQLFSIVNLAALLSWLALAAAPGRAVGHGHGLPALVVPVMLAVLYVRSRPSHWGGPGGFSSLAGVALLFSNPWLLLAGWVHYLAFDLLDRDVGSGGCAQPGQCRTCWSCPACS